MWDQERLSEFKFEIDEKNGYLIGPDGCHYASKAEAMYYGKLKLCGCGTPEDVHAFVIQCLESTHENYDGVIDLSKVSALIEKNPEVVAQFVLHSLENNDLIEHGGSVYGSWLTARGRQLVECGVMKEED